MIQPGAIYSGPAWKLWMILQYPNLQEIEDAYKRHAEKFTQNNVVRPMGDHDLERI